MHDGTIERKGDGFTIRFERDIAHPIDTVWDAITDPARLNEWLSEDTREIDLRVGGRVKFGQEIDSTITAIDPPRVIEYGWKSKDWDGGTVRWELESRGDGTRLVLTHSCPQLDPDGVRAQQEVVKNWKDPYSPTLAGWHTILDQLSAWLDGTASGPVLGHADGRWEKLHEHYRQVVT